MVTVISASSCQLESLDYPPGINYYLREKSVKKPVSQQPNTRPQEIRKQVQNTSNISRERKKIKSRV